MLTEPEGWPKVFEDAIIARWNAPPLAPSTAALPEQSLTQKVSQQIAVSVVRNLTNLSSTLKSKFVGNIIQNIQLAAAYLSVMLVVRRA